MPRRSVRRLLSFVFLLIGPAGCSEELGPVRRPTTTVTGSIVAAGRPITGGWIEFHPVDGTVGNLRSTPIGPDGSYRADGVPIGRVALMFVNLKTATPINLGVDLRVFRSIGSIRREIPPGDASRLDVDLAAEAREYVISRMAAGQGP